MNASVIDNYYHSCGDINVVNNFCKTNTSLLAWIVPITSKITESVVVFDHEGNILYFNNAFGTFVGCSQREMKNIYSLAHFLEDKYSNIPLALTKVLEIYKKPFPVKIIVRVLKTSENICFEGVPVLDRGNVIGIIGFARRHGRRRVSEIQRGRRLER